MAAVVEKAKELVGQMLRGVRSSKDKLASAEVPGIMTIALHSSTFQAGMAIPRECTQEGQSVSPQLSWEGVPATARELVLVCEDPDAPMPSPIVHWIAYNIPASVTSLPEGVPTWWELPTGGRQAKNYKGTPGYIGPMPPLGHGRHHYHFQLFAVNAPLEFSEPPDRDALVKAMQGKVVAEGELIGTYERLTAG